MGWFSRKSEQEIVTLANPPIGADNYPVWTDELEQHARRIFPGRDNFAVQFALKDGRPMGAFAIGGNYQGLSRAWEVRCLVTELNDGRLAAPFHFIYEGERSDHPDGSPKFIWRPRVEERIKGVFQSMDEMKTSFAIQCERVDKNAEESHQKIELKFTPEKIRRAQALKAQAEDGDADAQYELSQIYITGDGIPRDPQESLKWVRKAAEQEHPRAQWALGFNYEEGFGVEQSDAEAARWYRRSADHGNAEAQISLAGLYENGSIDGVQNFLMAIYWYKMAAEQGQTDAQFRLAHIYENTQQDFSKALEWYRKAAAQGDAPAEWRLGRAYYEGTGVPCDKEEGLKWYARALTDERFILRRSDLTEAEVKLFGHLKDRIAEPSQFI